MPIYRPFFLSQKEVDMFDHLNQELIDEISGQYVDVYKVEADESEVNPYGESTTKYWKAGYRVNCLVRYEEPGYNIDEFGPDFNSVFEVYFHKTTLSGSDFYPEIGDVVDWNTMYFEIDTVSEFQYLGSSPNFSHSVKCTGHKSRLSSLQIEERPR